MPAIAHELGAYDQLSWIVAAYLITSTISTPVYGKLSDIYGRRRLLITRIVFFIAPSLLCAAAQSLARLIGLRALQGLAGGGLMALTQAAIADVCHHASEAATSSTYPLFGPSPRCTGRSSAASWPGTFHGAGYSGSICRSARSRSWCAITHCAGCRRSCMSACRGSIFSACSCSQERFRSYCSPSDGAATSIPEGPTKFWALSAKGFCDF
ncbi:MAG: MFS transporter [Alphaproteobacteria bacterium]